jgi:nitrous oxidase accessory protein NosD
MIMTASARATLRTLVFACLTIAVPVGAKTFTVTQANIAQTLNAAAPGDHIVLSPGGYGVVVVPRKSWQTPITIDARAATMSGIVMFKVAGVTWSGGTVIGTGYGVSIADSARVSVSGVDISGAVRGIVINDSNDVKILKNKLHHLRTDGIDVVGQRVLVEGNVISDMLPIEGDHPDGIQVWSANDEQSRDITIRGNTITGNMQGIFARSPALGLSNLSVTGNKALVNYPNAIVVLDAKDSVVKGNTVKSLVGPKVMKANMRVEGVNNTACGNAVPDVPNALPARVCLG